MKELQAHALLSKIPPMRHLVEVFPYSEYTYSMTSITHRAVTFKKLASSLCDTKCIVLYVSVSVTTGQAAVHDGK